MHDYLLYGIPKFLDVDVVKNESIAEKRKTIIQQKKKELNLTSEDIAKKLGKSIPAYNMLENNKMSAKELLEQLSYILKLSSSEYDEISVFTGNLVEIGKKHALNEASNYICSTINQAIFSTINRDRKDHELYELAVFLLLTQNVILDLNEKHNESLLEIANNLHKKISSTLHNIGISQIGDIVFNNYSAFKDELINAKQILLDGIKLSSSSFNYDEIASISPSAHIYGDALKEFLSKRDYSIDDQYNKLDFASRIGYSRNQLYLIINNTHPISRKFVEAISKTATVFPEEYTKFVNSPEQEILSNIISSEYIYLIKNFSSVLPRVFYETGTHLKTDFNLNITEYKLSKILGNNYNYDKFYKFLLTYGYQPFFPQPVTMFRDSHNYNVIIKSMSGVQTEISIQDLDKLYTDIYNLSNELITQYKKEFRKPLNKGVIYDNGLIVLSNKKLLKHLH